MKINLSFLVIMINDLYQKDLIIPNWMLRIFDQQEHGGNMKHGGGHVMVWRYNGIGNYTFIDRTMNAQGYICR